MNFIEALKAAGRYGRIRNKDWNHDESIGMNEYSKVCTDYEELLGNQWELFDEEDK